MKKRESGQKVGVKTAATQREEGGFPEKLS